MGNNLESCWTSLLVFVIYFYFELCLWKSILMSSDLGTAWRSYSDPMSHITVSTIPFLSPMSVYGPITFKSGQLNSSSQYSLKNKIWHGKLLVLQVSHSFLNHLSFPEHITTLILIVGIQIWTFLFPFPIQEEVLTTCPYSSKFTSSSYLLSPSLANPRDSSQERRTGEGQKTWQEVKNSTTNSCK